MSKLYVLIALTIYLAMHMHAATAHDDDGGKSSSFSDLGSLAKEFTSALGVGGSSDADSPAEGPSSSSDDNNDDDASSPSPNSGGGRQFSFSDLANYAKQASSAISSATSGGDAESPSDSSSDSSDADGPSGSSSDGGDADGPSGSSGDGDDATSPSSSSSKDDDDDEDGTSVKLSYSNLIPNP